MKMSHLIKLENKDVMLVRNVSLIVLDPIVLRRPFQVCITGRGTKAN